MKNWELIAGQWADCVKDEIFGLMAEESLKTILTCTKLEVLEFLCFETTEIGRIFCFGALLAAVVKLVLMLFLGFLLCEK